MTNTNPAGYPNNPNQNVNPNVNSQAPMGPNPNMYAPQYVAPTPDKYGYVGPERFRPLSPWVYFGWGIVYSIPVIGLIFLIVHAFSDANINRRNFARSYFCSLL
jgi:hypothetical protein